MYKLLCKIFWHNINDISKQPINNIYMEQVTLSEALQIDNIHRALKESCQDQTDYLKSKWLL